MPIYTSTIEGEESLGTRVYEITGFGTSLDVTVTIDVNVAQEWLEVMLQWNRIHYLNSRLVVGLGVSWSPQIAGPDGSAETLNLCVGHRCLIYQIFCTDEVPETLRNLFQSDRCTFVGFWNNYDRHKLSISHHELEMLRDPLELRYFLNGNDAVARPEMNLRWDMASGDWGIEDLSEELVKIASLDAYHAYMFGTQIEAWRRN